MLHGYFCKWQKKNHNWKKWLWGKQGPIHSYPSRVQVDRGGDKHARSGKGPDLSLQVLTLALDICLWMRLIMLWIFPVVKTTNFPCFTVFVKDVTDIYTYGWMGGPMDGWTHPLIEMGSWWSHLRRLLMHLGKSSSAKTACKRQKSKKSNIRKSVRWSAVPNATRSVLRLTHFAHSLVGQLKFMNMYSWWKRVQHEWSR